MKPQPTQTSHTATSEQDVTRVVASEPSAPEPVAPGPVTPTPTSPMTSPPRTSGPATPQSSPSTASGPAAPYPPPQKTSGPLGGILLLLGLIALGYFVSLTALLVVLGLLFMLFMHEMGHFLTARWTGMKASEFFLGFGPRIWSFRRKETEFGVKLLPLGAYVRILGMSNMEDVPPGEEHRTYRSKPYRSRLLVAVAGSTMHFVIAIAGLWVLFGAVGYYSLNTTTEDTYKRWEIAQVVEGGPAEQAGLLAGDKIVATQPASQPSNQPGNITNTTNNSPQNFESYLEVRDFIQQNPNQDVTFIVERDGTTLAVPTDLGVFEDEGRAGVGMLGIIPTRLAPGTTGFFGGFADALSETGNMVRITFVELGRIFSPDGLRDFFAQVFGQETSPSEGATVSGASSEDSRFLSIYGVARFGTNLADSGDWGSTLLLYVWINVFIGLFNLVPLPPFDGGHVAVATYEKLRSRKGRPYRIDATKLVPLTYVVLGALLLIGIAALYLDISSPLGLT